MTITLEGTTDRRPEPKRDRYGRYLIAGRPWQRVTTLAKVLDDTSSLADWKARLTAVGLAKRSDLFAQVATCSIDDRKALNALCEQAKEAAGASIKANLGTAVHAMCEQVDLGTMALADVPEQWRADVAAYRRATAHMAWTHVEAIVVNRTLNVAGTMDRLGARVADIKTGSLDYAAVAIAIQMACYAYADEVYDPATDTLTPMPDVDKTTALVIHLPVGEGVCTLHEVDLAEGWRLAQLAAEVRDARSLGRRKHTLLRPMQPATPTERPTHISEPLGEVLERLEDVFAGLPKADDKPFTPKPTPQRIVAVAKPADEDINDGEGPWATTKEVDAARNALRSLTGQPYEALNALYVAAAKAHPSKHGISLKVPSWRRVLIANALVELAKAFKHLDDETLRCVGVVIPDAQQPAVSLADAYVALTCREVETFRAVARAVAAGQAALDLSDGRIAWSVPALAANPAA
jgi:hypothetical protein